ncbi:HhH-GPD family protein [Corynebacterium gerontici]|uniref:Adenine DNA glycosylase n=1 Tax=Corynebacterium gerontici TaxID=2079234 RepID=A0A3G6J2Q1_9CORY|nr:A/G-specific adenine glycosylase [Corynebacterium gerontici]AZA10680.1 A/G-specific adenine glycosylase [Corynebacterium gerontici]
MTSSEHINTRRIQRLVINWYRSNAREIVWRTPETSPWGVLLSEVMSQQTQVARVEPRWLEWMQQWPDPCTFAEAEKSDVLRAWGKLGYPRRALRLHECAQVICQKHAGEVPRDVDELLSLPGIGDYTARAVAAFAYGQKVPVVDTNVRRVLTRLTKGAYLSANASKRELKELEALLPQQDAATFSVGLMELGALVCTPTPKCEQCPLVGDCAWVGAGKPMPSEAELRAKKKKRQKFQGTDRQVRGLIMDVLRNADAPVSKDAIDVVWPDAAQRSRALFSLIEDELAEQTSDGRFQLPS